MLGWVLALSVVIGCMGALFGYYAAADDEDAVRAVVREDGQPMGAGYDSFVVKGVDPVVELLPAEVLVTGRTAGDIEADPRHGHLVGMVGDGEVVSLSLTDPFVNPSPVSTGSSWVKWPAVGLHRVSSALSRTRVGSRTSWGISPLLQRGRPFAATGCTAGSVCSDPGFSPPAGPVCAAD